MAPASESAVGSHEGQGSPGNFHSIFLSDLAHLRVGTSVPDPYLGRSRWRHTNKNRAQGVKTWPRESLHPPSFSLHTPAVLTWKLVQPLPPCSWSSHNFYFHCLKHLITQNSHAPIFSDGEMGVGREGMRGPL